MPISDQLNADFYDSCAIYTDSVCKVLFIKLMLTFQSVLMILGNDTTSAELVSLGSASVISIEDLRGAVS